MEGSCSTGQSPQRAAVPVEEEEEEEEEDMAKERLALSETRHFNAAFRRQQGCILSTTRPIYAIF
jgi:AraC-like DNA-binding protein